MLYAVVPAKNEEMTICHVVQILLWCGVDKVLIVANGCTDNTLQRVYDLKSDKVQVAAFPQSLGIDVPRAIGAILASQSGAERILFVDGDLRGEIAGHIQRLIQSSIQLNLDMALSNCYPREVPYFGMASEVVRFRSKLNQCLGVYEEIGIASPSHGPSIITSSALEMVDPRHLAIPPVALAAFVRCGLNVGIGSSIRHERLGSPDRGKDHAQRLYDTLIGDCLEAICFWNGTPRSRWHEGRYYDGYASQRRFDVLEAVYERHRVPPRKMGRR